MVNTHKTLKLRLCTQKIRKHFLKVFKSGRNIMMDLKPFPCKRISFAFTVDEATSAAQKHKKITKINLGVSIL